MLLTLAVLMMLIAGLTTGQFAGNNIALNKNATQLPGDYCVGSFCYTASLAVDGQEDYEGHLRGHCSHTPDNSYLNASWEVSFRGLYQITGIHVFNRKSTGQNVIGKRLRNFSVIGINSNTTTEQLIYTDNYTFIDENYPVITEIPLPNPPSVTGIRIEIPNRGEDEPTILTLCEVKVFSDFVCPNLTTDANTIISYSNKTNNGSVASFSCVPGYYLSQNNYSLVCQIYQWSGPPCICETVYCPLPLSISNGGYSISSMCASSKQNNSLWYNCSIRPYCNKGFNLTERKEWVCLKSGMWSGQEPVCQIVMCILPDKEQNGIQLHAKFSNGSTINAYFINYGTEIQLFCDVGFKTSSEIKWTCTEDGSWSGTTPVCNVVTCDHPGNNSVINGSYTDQSDKLYLSGKKIYSQTIKVLCRSGYLVTSGSETRSCEDNGTWSGMDSICTIVKCSPLKNVDGVFYEYSFSNESNINLIDTVIYLNATVNINCDNGMIPDGSKVRRCIENGTWDGIPSTCNAALPSSSTRAALIGGVTGAVVALLIVTVIVIVVIIMRRRKHKTEETSYFSRIQRQQRKDEEYDDISYGNCSISITKNESQAYNNVTADQNACGREYENTSSNTIKSVAGHDYMNAQ